MTSFSLARRIFYYVVLVCGVAASVELMALAAYWTAFQRSFSYRELQTSRLAQLGPTTEQTGIADERAPWIAAWAIHPYYGFVHNPAFNPLVNKFGFQGSEDQVQSPDLHRVVVALIGGSVTAELVSSAGDILKSEMKKIPRFRGKEIVILNLANGAFKEPQGLMVINDILSRGGHVDVLISLDGFNEIALPEAHGNLRNGISPFYPQHWRELVETRLSPAQLDKQARASFILDFRTWLASIFAKPVIRYSIAANFVWRVADLRLANAAAAYRNSAEEESPIDPAGVRLSRDQRAFLGPAVEYDTRRDLYTDIARNWGRTSVLLNNIMATQGGLYIHFLQPNQYVAGSKNLGKHEKEIAIHPASPYRTAIEIGYPYLQAMGESLRHAGLWFEDLTAVFANVDDELYKDSCCHVNQEGNAILAKAIVKLLAARLSTGGVSGARPLTLRQINFDDSLFTAGELRRLAEKAPDYRDGSLDHIGKASK